MEGTPFLVPTTSEENCRKLYEKLNSVAFNVLNRIEGELHIAFLDGTLMVIKQIDTRGADGDIYRVPAVFITKRGEKPGHIPDWNG